MVLFQGEAGDRGDKGQVRVVQVVLPDIQIRKKEQTKTFCEITQFYFNADVIYLGLTRKKTT